MTRPMASQPETAADPRVMRAACFVMVVEDDVSSRNALVMLLRHVGFDPTPVGTVAEAITSLQARRPDAVILDLMLPDGNGSSVLEHIRAERLPTRVAVASGAADWREMVDEARLHPDAVFLKPIDFPQLIRWLDDACSAAVASASN